MNNDKLNVYLKDEQKMLFLTAVGLSLCPWSHKQVPPFNTRFTKRQMTTWIHEINPNLTHWLQTESLSVAADAGNGAITYGGPLFHPCRKVQHCRKTYTLELTAEPVNGAYIASLLRNGRREQDRLIFGKCLLFRFFTSLNI